MTYPRFKVLISKSTIKKHAFSNYNLSRLTHQLTRFEFVLNLRESIGTIF